MVILRITLAVLFLSSSFAFADDVSKANKLKELMRLQGIYEMIEQQKTYGQEQAKSTISKLQQNYQADLQKYDQSIYLALEKANQKFIEAAMASPTSEEAVNAWCIYYGSGISENELDGIIAFYKSPEGQKDISATKAAMPQWSKFFLDKMNAAMEKAARDYSDQIRAIIDTAKQKNTK